MSFAFAEALTLRVTIVLLRMPAGPFGKTGVMVKERLTSPEKLFKLCTTTVTLREDPPEAAMRDGLTEIEKSPVVMIGGVTVSDAVTCPVRPASSVAVTVMVKVPMLA